MWVVNGATSGGLGISKAASKYNGFTGALMIIRKLINRSTPAASVTARLVRSIVARSDARDFKNSKTSLRWKRKSHAS